MAKETKQNKPIPPSVAKNASTTDIATAGLDQLLQQGRISQQAHDAAIAALPSAAMANALQLQNNFLDNLRKNPSDLARWQQAMTSYQNALGYTANYTQGYVDDKLTSDTSGVFSMLANNPQGNQDPYAALGAMTRSAAAAHQQVPAVLRLPPKFTPSDQATVDAGMQSAFHKAVGRDPTPSELKSFTQQYHQLEAQQYSQQTQATALGGGGGTVSNLGSPEAVAYENEVNAPEAVGYRASQLAQTLGDMIRAGHA